MKYKLLIYFILSSFIVNGQSGGKNVFAFLDLCYSAKIASLGGENISSDLGDPNLCLSNPAYQAKFSAKNVTFNSVWYLAGINYGNFLYQFNSLSTQNLALGFRYLNYGSFESRDANGRYEGTFRAADYSLDLIWNKVVLDSNLTIGVNIKPIYSQYETYSSIGISTDFGVFYRFKKNDISIGLVIKNVGLQLKKYNTEHEKLRPDIEVGITKKLNYAPFRFSITAVHLLDYQLSYNLVKTSNLFSDMTEQASTTSILSNTFKHFIFATEFLPTKSFTLNLAYNFLRRSELSAYQVNSISGFSIGFSLQFSKFIISYGRAAYHKAGGSDHFSIVYKL